MVKLDGITWIIKQGKNLMSTDLIEQERKIEATKVCMDEVISALRSGKEVTLFGSKVFDEKMNYSWQEPEIRIQSDNGSSVPANFWSFSSMELK